MGSRLLGGGGGRRSNEPRPGLPCTAAAQPTRGRGHRPKTGDTTRRKYANGEPGDDVGLQATNGLNVVRTLPNSGISGQNIL